MISAYLCVLRKFFELYRLFFSETPSRSIDFLSLGSVDLTEETTAWHEAGHAMMAVMCGGFVERVTIEPPDDDGPARYGDTVTRWSGMSALQLAAAEIRVSLAGPVVEMIFTGDHHDFEAVEEWSADWTTALAAARSVSKDEPTARKLLGKIAAEIHEAFESANVWAAVSAIADDLLAHETLEHEQIAYSVDFWKRW